MLATEKTLQQERFRIIHQFGRENQSAVYEAYDNILDANVLLAEVAGSLKSAAVSTPAQNQAQKSAFNDKAKVLSNIKHESLPRVHDYFSETDHHYLVMELVDGQDLESLLKAHNAAFSFAEISPWADQLLDALNYLHRNSPPVIHRHIKPQNIKLTADGKIKVLALGDAQIFGAKTSAPLTTSASDDALPYLPLELIWEGLDPASKKVILTGYDERSEKILEQPADARSDVYSLGATLYHLMTGSQPIDALARSIEILDGNADPLATLHESNADIPEAISEVIMRAMEIKRESRFDSAIIMRQVLRTALVRVKERENEQASQQVEEAALRLKTAEQKRLEQERELIEQKRIEAEEQRLEEERRLVQKKEIEIEAERKRQADLVDQQMRESEAEKQLAEQSAAEAEKAARQEAEVKNAAAQKAAEKRAAEKRAAETKAAEIFELDILDIDEASAPRTAPVKSKPAPEMIKAQAMPAVEASPEREKSFAASSETGLFAEQQANEKSGGGRMAAIAGALVLVCAAIAGIWFLTSSNSTESKQNAPGQTVSLSETAKPPLAENTAPPEQKISTESTAAPAPTAAPEVTTAAPVAPEVKNKPAAPAAAAAAPTPKIQKQPTPAPKTPAAQTPQKKAVTVDDLIGGN